MGSGRPCDWKRECDDGEADYILVRDPCCAEKMTRPRYYVCEACLTSKLNRLGKIYCTGCGKLYVPAIRAYIEIVRITPIPDARKESNE